MLSLSNRAEIVDLIGLNVEGILARALNLGTSKKYKNFERYSVPLEVFSSYVFWRSQRMNIKSSDT